MQRQFPMGARAPTRAVSRDYISTNRHGGFDGLGGDAPLTTVSITDLDKLKTTLASTWNPSGFYTPTQLWELTNQFYKIYLAVSKIADDYLASSLTLGKSAARAVQDTLRTNWHSFADRYLKANTEAQAAGVAYIDAPGLKADALTFVGKMHEGVRSMVILTYANEVAWGSIPGARTYLAVCVGAANVIRAIAGVAVDVVKAAGKAILKIPDTIGTLITVAKWGAVAYAGFWLYREFGRARQT